MRSLHNSHDFVDFGLFRPKFKVFEHFHLLMSVILHYVLFVVGKGKGGRESGKGEKGGERKARIDKRKEVEKEKGGEGFLKRKLGMEAAKK